MIEAIEKMLEGFDDRFEVTGEMLLRLADDKVAEVSRVLFAWTLSDKADRLSVKEMVLVIEGRPGDIAKVLSAKGKEGDLGPSETEGAGVILKMHKGLVSEINKMAKDGEPSELAEVLMGSERSTKVFDFSNYDVLVVEVE